MANSCLFSFAGEFQRTSLSFLGCARETVSRARRSQDTWVSALSRKRLWQHHKAARTMQLFDSDVVHPLVPIRLDAVSSSHLTVCAEIDQVLCDPCSRYDSDLVGWRVDESVNLEAQKLLVSFRVPCSEQIHPIFLRGINSIVSGSSGNPRGERKPKSLLWSTTRRFHFRDGWCLAPVFRGHTAR